MKILNNLFLQSTTDDLEAQNDAITHVTRCITVALNKVFHENIEQLLH